MVKKRKKKSVIWFYCIGLIFLLTFYLYKFVLPYKFVSQWQVTPSNINTFGTYDFTEEDGVFLGKKVKSYYLPDTIFEPAQVLGHTTEPKKIEVDLTNQKVYAYEGEKKVMEFLVSTGKWGATPTGLFTITYKNRVQKMSGGNKLLGTYYYLPNVQFVQFFGNDEIPWWKGFSFHGAYWHNNFGTPMSHGCINMRNEDAEALYHWTDPDLKGKKYVKAENENEGTRVVIYGVTPKT